jgi:predicted dehydrogenase
MIVVGAGSRGSVYAAHVKANRDAARIVGVAEPRSFYRNRVAHDHRIPSDLVAADWRELVVRPQFADAVIISTPDTEHVEPAVAFASRGYHVLLEKPMAPNAADCRRIVEAAQGSGVMLAVCHVMRYTRYTETLREILASGRIGEIVSLDHLEPVGYWHQAHSFVRGNWGNEAASASMLLAKSCHDLDWIRHVMGQPCVQVSSFGSLQHFRREAQPAGAADRCLDCAVEPTCPYSAKSSPPTSPRRACSRRCAPGRTGAASTPATTTSSITRW